MIIVEYAYVDDIGAKSAHCHLGISQNEHIPGLTWLAENIKECGAAAGIQISHAGHAFIRCLTGKETEEAGGEQPREKCGPG